MDTLTSHPNPSSRNRDDGQSVRRWDWQAPFRYLVDMHVPDWDPQMMAVYDADRHVRLVKQTGARALMIYANSHAGHCLWPTQVGVRHRSMGGRDFFGETVTACRRYGLVPRGYFSVFFDALSYERHPEWRQVPSGGEESVLGKRRGLVCPNAPGYRDYVASCMREIFGAYDIPDIFFDMMFLITSEPCLCTHCSARFRDEHGQALPRVENWEDATWRALHGARQEWILDFARFVYRTVKALRPEATVSHNQASFLQPGFVAPFQLVEACDYAFGDFYGGPTEHSLACKLFHSLKPDVPLECATFVKHDYADHVTLKTDETIRVESAIPALHGGAVLQIDAVNVDGTLNPAVYARLAAVNASREPFADCLGGRLLSDLGLYLDRNSMHPACHGQGMLHLDAAVGAARVLQKAHVPFSIVTNANLDQIDDFQAIILPGVLEMTSDQADVFRRYTANGGRIYASGVTALDRFGSGASHYLLEDVFGVRFMGYAGETATYLTPADAAVSAAVCPQDHLLFRGPCCRAVAVSEAQVLAALTLPFTPPSAGKVIGQTFASFHSNPPALVPERSPALTLNRFGKGFCIWSAMPFEREADAAAQRLLRWVVHTLLPGALWFEAEAPASVEVTLRRDDAKSRSLLSLLHLTTPPVPVGARLSVRLPPETRLRGIRDLRTGADMPFVIERGRVQLEIPPFSDLAVLALEYGGGDRNGHGTTWSSDPGVEERRTIASTVP